MNVNVSAQHITFSGVEEQTSDSLGIRLTTCSAPTCSALTILEHRRKSFQQSLSKAKVSLKELPPFLSIQVTHLGTKTPWVAFKRAVSSFPKPMHYNILGSPCSSSLLLVHCIKECSQNISQTQLLVCDWCLGGARELWRVFSKVYQTHLGLSDLGCADPITRVSWDICISSNTEI